MTKFKQLLPIIFLSISTILMSLFLYFYVLQIELTELRLEDNNVIIQTKNKEDYIIRYSNNPLICELPTT